jgi:hypothetical protein
VIRQTDKQNNKRFTKTALLLLITLVVWLGACGNNRSFDSSAWLQGDRRARGRMADDLIKRRILIGQSADEAIRVLGQPNIAYATALSYKIDLGWIFKSPEHYGLIVDLDEKRIVREVRIVD